MPKTCAIINLENIQQFIINDGIQSCCHNYQTSAFIFANVITECNEPILELYSHGLLGCLIHFRQLHNNMHGHPNVIQNFDNQNKNVHTATRHP